MGEFSGRYVIVARAMRRALVCLACCVAVATASQAFGAEAIGIPAKSATFCSTTIAEHLYASGIDTNAELASYEATGTCNGEAVLQYLRPMVAEAERLRAEEAARLAEEARKAEAARQAAAAARRRAEVPIVVKPKELEMVPYPYY